MLGHKYSTALDGQWELKNFKANMIHQKEVIMLIAVETILTLFLNKRKNSSQKAN